MPGDIQTFQNRIVIGFAYSILGWWMTVPLLLIAAFLSRHLLIKWAKTTQRNVNIGIVLSTVLTYATWVIFLGYCPNPL
jgi:hypothetical protein